MTLGIYDIRQNDLSIVCNIEYLDAECHDYLNVMLSVIMPSVVMLSVVVPLNFLAKKDWVDLKLFGEDFLTY